MKTLSFLAIALLAVAACANPADDVPAADVSQTETESTEEMESASTESAQTTTYEIADGSTIGFVGSKITGSHDGGFHGFDGTITLAGDDPTQGSVDLVIDTTTLWADNERLTGHLKSPDFFDVEKFPTATFTSSSIVPSEEGYTVTGELDLHGVTKTISFPAEIVMEADRVTARTEFSIKRFDFDIVYPGKPDDLIRDEVVVKLDIVAVPTADAGV